MFFIAINSFYNEKKTICNKIMLKDKARFLIMYFIESNELKTIVEG